VGMGATLCLIALGCCCLPDSWGSSWWAYPSRSAGACAFRGAPCRLSPLLGCARVAGFGLFALGARDGIAISAVLASQFGALAGVMAYLLFRERLARVQVAGVATIVVGVGILSALRA